MSVPSSFPAQVSLNDATQVGTWGDYWELAKPRIVMMELVTLVAGFWLAADSGWAANPWLSLTLVASLLGTALVAASAGTLNQWIEADRDAVMQRTSRRPIPMGRVDAKQAILSGAITMMLGFPLLVLGVGPVVALCGLFCWALYVAVYTPLKAHSTWNTAVGAASGSIPIVMGYLAGGGQSLLVGLALFGVLYLWQYPHFMAIAWRCRDDYRRAGMVMATTVDPSGKLAGEQSLWGAALLLPVGLVPAVVAGSAWGATMFVACSMWLGYRYLVAAYAFSRQPADDTSRQLLRSSLWYLPMWMLSLAWLGW